MVTRRVNDPNDKKPRRTPARTPEAREQELIALAVDVAEDQMRNGNASAQVISHYLKLGSSRERLEQERLAQEVELLKIKRETIASQQRIEELYTEALNSMRRYSGQDIDTQPEDQRSYDS